VVATTLPTAIVAGSKVHGTVTITLNNQTSSTVFADHITVFAASNGDINNATPLVSKPFKRGISIAAGQTKALKLTVKSFPASAGDGKFILRVQVSSSLSQTSNSATGPSVTVAAPFVNLAGASGTGIVSPNAVKAGKPVSLTIDLTNSGNIPSGLASLSVGLSTNGQTESTVLETPVVHIKIKPGHAGVLRLRVKIPPTVQAGMYKPFVSITDDGDSTTVIGQAFTVEA
jgi:hypothetical protein